MKIGVLAVQGAFREHEQMLRDLGADVVQVRLQPHLEGLEGLVIPGGESTAIGKLMRAYGLVAPIRAQFQQGMPVFGTCAGMIIMANRIHGGDEPHLGLMDVEVNRNSFGRQRESFETDLEIPAIGATPDQPFPAVFIRAPHIASVGSDVQVLSRYEDRVVAVRQGNALALSFHPELTGDNRIHQYFMGMVEESSRKG